MSLFYISEVTNDFTFKSSNASNSVRFHGSYCGVFYYLANIWAISTLTSANKK
jgi:hypothetical protein